MVAIPAPKSALVRDAPDCSALVTGGSAQSVSPSVACEVWFDLQIIRTLLTTGHPLLIVVALLLLGGDVLHNCAFALLVGMIAGTYSTSFITSPLLVYSHTWIAARTNRSPVGAVDAP